MGEPYKYIFTIFTPTYNRAHTLARVYCSLKRQSFKSFEWLVIDDGSSDGTQKLISSWKRESPFDIRYYWQKNSGKHVAINRGVRLARGEFFLIADSDDAFMSYALERFYLHWNSIPKKIRKQFSAVGCHCIDEEGRPIGKPFPEDPLDSNSEEIYFRYKITSEKWGVHRTDVLKQFPFPEINAKFLPESFIWNRIAKYYKVRFVNEYMRIYYQDAGNQIMKKEITEIASRRFFYADSLNLSSEWLPYDPIRFLKNGTQYVRFCLWSRESMRIQWKRLFSKTAKIIWFVSIVPGLIIWAADKKIPDSWLSNKILRI